MPEREPLDEDAAWAAIVAAYDEETAPEPEPTRRLVDGRAPGGSGEPDGEGDPAGGDRYGGVSPGDVRGVTGTTVGGGDAAEGELPDGAEGPADGASAAAPDRARDPDRAGSGEDGDGDGTQTGPAAPFPPRRLGPDTPVNSVLIFSSGDGPRDWEAAEPDEDDDHFVPPEPPPLPPTDTTTKMAWAGAVGGPLLLIGAVLFQQPITWWMWSLGIGGFLGGFVTLVARMGGDDEDGFDDPGRGAVV